MLLLLLLSINAGTTLVKLILKNGYAWLCSVTLCQPAVGGAVALRSAIDDPGMPPPRPRWPRPPRGLYMPRPAGLARPDWFPLLNSLGCNQLKKILIKWS